MKLVLLFITLLASAYAGGSPSPVEPFVARYKGDARAAFSYTFDDGRVNEVADALGVIDALGIRGTFFVMPWAMETSPKSFVGWPTLRKMQQEGHEIGTHAQIAPKLHETDDATLRKIVSGGWQLISDNLGRAPVSFAYPGGTARDDPRVQGVIAEHHPFVRTKYVSYGTVGKRIWNPEAAKKQVDEAMASGAHLVAVVHSIVGGYAPFESVAQFRTYCEWLCSRQPELWIAPFGIVQRYMHEQRSARVSVREQSDSKIEFEVDFGLNPAELFNERLTVVVPIVGTGMAEASTASGARLPVTVGAKKVLVEVGRTDGLVRLTWRRADSH